GEPQPDAARANSGAARSPRRSRPGRSPRGRPLRGRSAPSGGECEQAPSRAARSRALAVRSKEAPSKEAPSNDVPSKEARRKGDPVGSSESLPDQDVQGEGAVPGFIDEAWRLRDVEDPRLVSQELETRDAPTEVETDRAHR